MGIDIEYEESLFLARRIALYNAQTLFNIKNSLMYITEEIIKEQKIEHEKFTILVKTNWPNADPELLIANPEKNINHDLLKLDVELIQEMLLEGKKTEETII